VSFVGSCFSADQAVTVFTLLTTIDNDLWFASLAILLNRK